MKKRGKRRIVLASASKRRTQILKSCGISHTVTPSCINECDDANVPARGIVLLNARKKAATVAGLVKDSIVIGVDTMVLFKGRLIGKPRTAKEARTMLRRFSGNCLAVYTGISVVDTVDKMSVHGYERTDLRIKRIEPKDIDRYFRLLGPYDKAGGFSIEGVGSMLFDDLKGSYFNVLGLPMGRLQELFRDLGFDILDFIS